MDRAGIVYFGRVFEWCHIAYEELMTALFGGIEGVFSGTDWGMPLVHAEADYKAPMKLDDRLTIELRIERLGGSSVAFGYRVVGPDADLRATAKLVHAFVDMRSFSKRAAPEAFVDGVIRLGLVPSDAGG